MCILRTGFETWQARSLAFLSRNVHIYKMRILWAYLIMEWWILNETMQIEDLYGDLFPLVMGTLMLDTKTLLKQIIFSARWKIGPLIYSLLTSFLATLEPDWFHGISFIFKTFVMLLKSDLFIGGVFLGDGMAQELCGSWWFWEMTLWHPRMSMNAFNDVEELARLTFI